MFQLGGGTALVTLPIWTKALTDGAHLVAAVCGAIIGVGGVFRLFRRRERRRGGIK